MKRTLSMIAMTAALTVPAYADSSKLQTEVDRYVNGSDVSMLDDTTRDSLETIVFSGSSSFGERQAVIYSILESNGGFVEGEETANFMMTEPQFAGLQKELNRYGDYDVDTMSKQEILTAMSIVYAGGTFSERQAKLDGALS